MTPKCWLPLSRRTRPGCTDWDSGPRRGVPQLGYSCRPTSKLAGWLLVRMRRSSSVGIRSIGANGVDQFCRWSAVRQVVRAELRVGRQLSFLASSGLTPNSSVAISR